MFKFLLNTFFLTFLIVNCSPYGQIRVTRDDFKNTHIVNLKQRLESTEKNPTTTALGDFFAAPFYAVFDYSRELNGSKTIIPTIIRVSVTGTRDNLDLTPKGFLRIGGKNFDISLNEISSELITTVTATSKKSSSDGKAEVSTTSHVHKKMNGTFSLTKEQEALISNTDEFTVRIYSGSHPVTFAVSGEDTLKLKEFLSTKAPGQ